MTVASQTPVASSIANGVTTTFPHNFTVLLAGDLVVTGTLNGFTTTYVNGVDYTITGLGASSGSVVFTVAPANGTEVIRYRDTAILRATDYQSNGDLLSAVLNADIDRQVYILQEVVAGGKGSPTALRVPNGETVPQLPNAAGRANRVQAYDGNGDPLLIVGVDVGSAAALALDLADSTSAAKGPQLLAYDGRRAYTGRSVGKALRSWVNVMDWIDPALWAAIESGSSTVDVYAALQQCVLDRPTKDIRAPAGLYRFTRGFYLKTGQCLYGETGTKFKALTGSFVGTTGVLGTAPFIWNENRNTTTLTDKDISIECIEFDYDTVTVVGGGAHAIRLRAVDRPRIINCKGTGGENLTALLACRDSLTDECEAYNMLNCWFDHWDGAKGGVVRNCVGRNDPGFEIAQGLQFTGTGSNLEDRDSYEFIAEGNRLYGVRGATGQSSALIFNTNDAGSSNARCKSIGNYIEDADLGIVMEGDIGHHVSMGDTLRNVTSLPIFIKNDTGSPTDCRVIDATLIDCDHDFGNIAMVVIEGVRNSVKGLRVVNTGAALYGSIARIVSGSTDCSVHIESAPTGSAARVANESTTGYVSDRGFLDHAIKTYPTIASASTIAPTQGVTFVSGTATISTITPPVGVLQGGSIKLIATAGWATNTAGNIATTMTATTNRMYVFEYDPNLNKWYPTN